MSQKSLIIVVLVLFAGSAFFLFWRNERDLDPDRGKSWWTLSFISLEEPQRLDFTVENHSANTEFRYEIVRDKRVLEQAVFTTRRGETKTVTPSIAADPVTKTSVIVTTGKEKKEIYR